VRIAIVAHNLRVAGGLSVGKNVVSALSRVADQHEYLLVLPAGVGYEDAPKPRRATCYFCRWRGGLAGQLFFEQWRLPRVVRRFKPDLVWGLGNFGLLRPGAPQAVLLQQAYYVYDATKQRTPIWRTSYKTRYGIHRLKRSLRATQLVFCQTETMAGRFKESFQYTGKVQLFPNAVSRLTSGGTLARAPVVFTQLSNKFVLLCLTRYYRHKNLESLVDLFTQHREPLSDVAIILTIAADDMPGAARLLSRIDELGLAPHLVNVGPIAQEQLASYFANSDALILPTVLESFSGTYLEAMCFGCPLLTSNMDFAREVCGSAALYFDPYETESIRDAILHLKSSSAERAKLIKTGRRRYESLIRDWDSIVCDAMRHLEELSASARRGAPGT